MNNSRLVYSTEFGRACPECGRPIDDCVCPRGRAARRAADDAAPSDPGDGIVRVRRETKSRGGKTVTTITGVPTGSRPCSGPRGMKSSLRAGRARPGMKYNSLKKVLEKST
jgi:hypothetical protein